MHDPDAVYVKRWLPELASLPPTLAREPWRLDPKGIRWASRSTSLRRMPFLRGFQGPPTVQEEEPATAPGSARAGSLWQKIVAFFLPKARARFPLRLPSRRGSSPHAFRYGVDYPKPVTYLGTLGNHFLFLSTR